MKNVEVLKNLQNMMNGYKKGDTVMITGGLFKDATGTVIGQVEMTENNPMYMVHVGVSDEMINWKNLSSKEA